LPEAPSRRGQFFYMTNQKNFYAVITSALLCRQDINDKEKLLIALINNLSNEKGYCWANNHYLADCLGCDERTIQRCIANLEKKKIINRVMNLDAQGNLEFRALIVIDPMTSSASPHDKSDITPHDKNVIYNNKDIKNKYISKFIPPTLDEVIDYFKFNGYTRSSAERAFKYYSEGQWMDGRGNKVKNWKQKMQGVWFKDENKDKAKEKPVIW
jgi:DNA-binding MarR family transcriptional regulator